MGIAEFTTQEIVDGITVVGFVERGPGAESAELTLEQDNADLVSRLQALTDDEKVRFAVVDFMHYRPTGSDNGRAVVSIVLAAQGRLRKRGGGLCVCHHPAQFHPDLQHIMRVNDLIGIYRSRDEAIRAALGRSMGSS